MTRLDSEIQQIAKSQSGVICIAQLRRLGVGPDQIWRRVRSREWVRELHGVWRLSWAEPSWMQKIWCASLRGGNEGLISHQAAAWLWDLDGVKLKAVDLSTPLRLRSPVAWFAPREVSPIPRGMRRMRKGVALTSPSRTLVDLAGVLGREALQEIVEQAFRRRITSVGELQHALQLAPAHGKAGTGVLSSVLEGGLWDDESQSELERQAMRFFEEFGLPRPSHPFRVFEGHRLLATVDFAWPEAKLIVEAEGFQFHSGREAWEKDIGRYNSLLVRGWTVLRLTSEHLRGGGEDFALSLSTALANAASHQLAHLSGSEKNRRTRVQA